MSSALIGVLAVRFTDVTDDEAVGGAGGEACTELAVAVEEDDDEAETEADVEAGAAGLGRGRGGAEERLADEVEDAAWDGTYGFRTGAGSVPLGAATGAASCGMATAGMNPAAAINPAITSALVLTARAAVKA